MLAHEWSLQLLSLLGIFYPSFLTVVCFFNLQPIARFQGQATDVNLARREVNNVKTELVSKAMWTSASFCVFSRFKILKCQFVVQ